MIYLVTNQTSLFDQFTNIKLISVKESLYLLNKETIIGVDTETTGLDCHTENIFLLQLGTDKYQIVIDTFTVNIKHYKPLLENKNILKIGANLKFDYKFFLKNDIVLTNIYDVLIAEFVLYNGITSQRLTQIYINYDTYCRENGFPLSQTQFESLLNKAKHGFYSLMSLAFQYCNVSLDKEMRSIMTTTLTQRLIEYSANDVKYLLEIREKQLEIAQETNCERTINLENNFLPSLAYTEYCGIKLDEQKWLEVYNKNIIRLDKLKEELNQWIVDNNITKFISNQLDLFESDSTVTINWNSSNNVYYIFHDILGFELKDKHGKKTTDAKILIKYEKKNSLVPKYLEYSGVKKETSTYGKDFLKHINPITKRVHPDFTQIVNTGRLSSNKPNLQNIPATEEFRECFVASENTVLIDADYSGQESVILTNYSMEKNLIEFYEKDLGDLHSYVAKLTFPEELKDIALQDVKAKRKDLRQQAKSVEFAVGYGGTGFTISNNIGISIEEGNRIYDAYFKAFPDLKSYFKKVGDSAKRNGFIIMSGITGRRYYIPEYNDFLACKQIVMQEGFWQSEELKAIYKDEMKRYFTISSDIQRLAQNYPIQSSGAETIKVAAYFFYKWILENNLMYKVMIVNLVHDEILIECDKELEDIVMAKVKECMEKSGDFYCRRIKLTADPESANYWIH